MIFLYFFIEMTNPPNPVDDFMHRLSVDIFGEDVVDNTNPSQYYKQPQHANLPLHPQSNYIPQDLNYQPQVYPHHQWKRDHQKRRGKQLTPPTMHLGGVFMNK
jgi:hypothetical protein